MRASRVLRSQILHVRDFGTGDYAEGVLVGVDDHGDRAVQYDRAGQRVEGTLPIDEHHRTTTAAPRQVAQSNIGRVGVHNLVEVGAGDRAGDLALQIDEREGRLVGV